MFPDAHGTDGSEISIVTALASLLQLSRTTAATPPVLRISLTDTTCKSEKSNLSLSSDLSESRKISTVSTTEIGTGASFISGKPWYGASSPDNAVSQRKWHGGGLVDYDGRTLDVGKIG
jgi:hypothetical protein